MENEHAVLTVKDTNFLMEVDDKSKGHKGVLQSVDVLHRKKNVIPLKRTSSGPRAYC